MCIIGPGITWAEICSMLIIENMTTLKYYFTMENKQFFQGQMFISHTLYQLPVTSACGIPFLRNTEFLGTNVIYR